MKKYHCYGNKQIFNEVVCLDDCCQFYYACKVTTGHKVDMFEYELINKLIDILPKREIYEILASNYNISYNACKQAFKRAKKKRNEKNKINTK
jgi:hypothetical protein